MTIIEEPAEKGREKQSTGKTVTNLLIGLVVLAAGLALIFGMMPGGPMGGTAVPPSTTAEGGPPVARAPGAVDESLGASAPTRVSIPAIPAESSLIATGLRPDGTIDVPPIEQPMQASWYDQGPTPGEEGPAVVLGHVSGNGQPGIFANLNRVVAGDLVHVDRADGSRVTFQVSQVDTFRKDSFPTDLVYNDTPNAALRLITCGGEYDAGNRNYLSNIVVYADLVSVQQPT